MAHTFSSVAEVIATYKKLENELMNFKEENFGWIPDEWVWRNSETEAQYNEMLENFQLFQIGKVVLDMDDVVFKNVNKRRECQNG